MADRNAPAPGLSFHCPPRDARALLDALYVGDLFRFSGLAAMSSLVQFTRGVVEERLAPHAPVEIHRHLPAEALTTRLADVQKAYASSDEVKRLWGALFESIGLDPEDTARDRLVLRFQVSSEAGSSPPYARSTSTVGFHRDSWGTNLPAQVNWWAPVWPITAGRTFAIYPKLWDVRVPNDSADFDLAEVMERVRTAPQDLKPGALAPSPTVPIDAAGGAPVLLEPGEIIAFSSAHAHAGIPNHTGSTRISLETRTVSTRDVRSGRGAPNIDGEARWMAPGLFRRLADGVALHTILRCDRLTKMGNPSAQFG